MAAVSGHSTGIDSRAESISHFVCDVQPKLIKNADKSTFSGIFVSAQGLGRDAGLKSQKNRNLYTFAYVIRALLQNGIIHTIHFIILRALPHLTFNSKNS